MTALSLSYLTLPGAAPAELIHSAHAAGLSHVGLRVGGRQPMEPGNWIATNRSTLALARRELNATGVEVLSVSAHYVNELTTVPDFGPVFDAGAALGASYLCISNHDKDEIRAGQTIAALAATAESYALALTLEFVPYSATRTLDMAMRIIELAASKNLSILLDLLHFMRSGSSIATLRVLPANRLGYVQLCDGPLVAPNPARLSDEARSARFLPGNGEFPLHEILEVLPRGALFEIETPQAQSLLSSEEQVVSAARAARATLRANGFPCVGDDESNGKGLAG